MQFLLEVFNFAIYIIINILCFPIYLLARILNWLYNATRGR
jgi:hypothetical protein